MLFTALTPLLRASALAALALCTLVTTPALAGESEAETCLRTKVWEGYNEGWGIRTMTSSELAEGKTRNYLVTLYKGNEYKISTCGDANVAKLDVLLYDTEGNVVTRAKEVNREPMIAFTPEDTGTYYIVLYLREVVSKKNAGAAMAVVYK
jgi:hypothetical protein